jgi:DNA polymerase-1
VLRHAVEERIHPVYGMETATRRWTATAPNVLGVGRRTAALLAERDLVRAEPGHVLIGADLSGIDARAVAGLSGDAEYAALLRPDVDIHSEVSALFYNDRNHRELAKKITHGLNYGRGAASIAADTNTPVPEVERLIDAYFSSFPLLAAWQTRTRRSAQQHGKLDTRTGHSVEVNRERAYTTGPGVLAQAVARDLAMAGLLRLHAAGLTPHLRLFIHDEVLLSVPAGQAAAMTDELVEHMSFSWKSPSGLVVPVLALPHPRPADRWSGLYGSDSRPASGPRRRNA